MAKRKTVTEQCRDFLEDAYKPMVVKLPPLVHKLTEARAVEVGRTTDQVVTMALCAALELPSVSESIPALWDKMNGLEKWQHVQKLEGLAKYLRCLLLDGCGMPSPIPSTCLN